MKFAIGDLIIYGETGVCKVIDIVEKPFLGVMQSCYQLQPLYQSCAIFTPTDNSNVFMRPIISKDEANAIIESAVNKTIEIYTATSPKALSEKYDKIIKSHDCGEMLLLSRSIREKCRRLTESKKKLSAIDERFLKKAEDLLFGELAVALEIEKNAVSQYIQENAVK